MTEKTAEGRKRKILVIDDELDLRESLKEVLGDEGYEVITACDGFEGIKKSDESDPDLIILDLNMPRMDGITTLRKIRKTDQDVAVIILTGYGSAETARDALDLDVHEYISKPFELDVMRNAIKEALASSDR